MYLAHLAQVQWGSPKISNIYSVIFDLPTFWIRQKKLHHLSQHAVQCIE